MTAERPPCGREARRMRVGPVVLLAAALVAGGCGTVCNLAEGVQHPERGPRPYGGLQKDAEVLAETSACGSLPPGSGWVAVETLVVMFGDFPLSFVGDTLTL